MELSELCSLVASKARCEALKKILAAKRNRIVAIDGLAGSAAAMMFAALPKRKTPYLIIANDLDEAGYLYFDLCQIAGEAHVLIFPSGYKRDIKYGQVDAPSEILRTEVLTCVGTAKGGRLDHNACTRRHCRPCGNRETIAHIRLQ